MATTANDPVIDSPEWWLLRLLKKLHKDQLDRRLWNDYYTGNHPLSFFDEGVANAFGSRFKRFTSNFTALAIDAVADRLIVDGFRFRDATGDKDLWKIWQENDLDGGSLMAHTDALVNAASYTLVEPQPGDKTPKITVESAEDCIVELDPRTREKRRAGLKRWVDDAGKMVVYVYLPDGVYKYRSVNKWGQSSPLNVSTFEKLEIKGEQWPLKNPLGEVPLVPLVNRPTLKNPLGVSDIELIRSNQDLIAYYRVMAVIAARYAAWPQRYASNVPIEIDELTGLPKQPFKGGIADLWVIEPYDADDPRATSGAAQPQFGQFNPTTLAPFLQAIEWEVGAMSAIAKVPAYMLLGTPRTVPLAAETLKAEEAGLIAKVERIETYLGEGWEETMRLALKATNDPRAQDRTAETRWANRETRNEAVHTDAIVKLHAEGIIDDELSQELYGLSAEQMRQLAARKKKAEANKPTPPPVPPPAPGTPPGVIPAPTGPRMGNAPPIAGGGNSGNQQ